MDGLINYRSLREAVETLGLETFVAMAVNEARTHGADPRVSSSPGIDARFLLDSPLTSKRQEIDDAIARADW